MGGIIEDITRAVPIIGDPIADLADDVVGAATNLVGEIPIIGEPIAGVAQGLLGTIGQDEGDANFTTTTALTPEPRVAPTAIPLPEEPVNRRRRAAQARQGRRGRSSTILTALNNEPLGGG